MIHAFLARVRKALITQPGTFFFLFSVKRQQTSDKKTFRVNSLRHHLPAHARSVFTYVPGSIPNWQSGVKQGAAGKITRNTFTSKIHNEVKMMPQTWDTFQTQIHHEIQPVPELVPANSHSAARERLVLESDHSGRMHPLLIPRERNNSLVFESLSFPPKLCFDLAEGLENTGGRGPTSPSPSLTGALLSLQVGVLVKIVGLRYRRRHVVAEKRHEIPC